MKVFPFCLLALGSSVAQAQTAAVTIQASERGWVCNLVDTPCAVYGQAAAVLANNGASPTNNVFTGSGQVPDDVGQTFNAGTYRNWFEFPIPKLTGPLVSAVLTLPEPNRWNAQDLAYTIYGLSGQPAAFADVHGTVYGTITTHATDIGNILYLNFNAAGLAAVTGAQGTNLFIGGIDSGESIGGYHGDFSGTGATDTPPYPSINRNTPLVLTVGTTTSSVSVNQTCAAPPAGLNGFVIEHDVDLTKILSSLTPNVPAAFGPVFAGTKVARDRIAYDAATGLLTNDIYLVDPNAPIPTPPTFDILANRLIYQLSSIQKVMLSCKPRPSVAVVGTTIDGYPIYGDPAGAPVMYSFGYTMDSPPLLRDVNNVVGGVADVWEASSWGVISFKTVGASIAGAPVITTTSPTVVLDGSGSSGGPLLYSWSSVGYGVGFVDSSVASPTVYIGAGYGDYVVSLTVTNPTLGETSTAVAVIRYQAGS